MKALDNLVSIGELSQEAPDQTEFGGMVAAAETRLQDAGVEGISIGSKFSLAYGAAHALSLAALRWHGYRSHQRFIVFQCLQHTIGLDNAKWRVLAECHRRRNLAEYEGQLDVDVQLLADLIEITQELLDLVKGLDSVRDN